jgi:hypothetical protein
MKNENIQPLLFEAMEAAGYVKDGKPIIYEFADYIGVAPKTVITWKKSISVIATFALKQLIENEKLRKELSSSRKFKSALKEYLEK